MDEEEKEKQIAQPRYTGKDESCLGFMFAYLKIAAGKQKQIHPNKIKILSRDTGLSLYAYLLRLNCL